MAKVGALDARQNFSPAQVKEMEELLQINDQLKTLDKRKKTLVENVKNYMGSINATDIEIDGIGMSLTESTRRTVTAKTKDEFIAQLVSSGKKHLVKTSIEPDIDSIFAEVDAGILAKDFVEQYIKVTPVITLRCD